MKPDELIHHGVRGMRWGVRRNQLRKAKNSFLKKKREASNRYRNLTGSKRSAALKKYRRKNIDGMSDKDLQAAVNRMNLERQYRTLTKVDFYRGKRAVDTMYNNQNAMNRTYSSAKTAKKAAITYGAKVAAKIAAG